MTDDSGYRRRLIDPANGTEWSVSVTGSILTMVSGVGKSERIRMREADDPSVALRAAQQECLSRLRKGMVLTDPSAAVGQPVLQRSVGRGYTGALPIASDGRFVVTTDSTGALVEIDPSTADLKERFVPAENSIIWQIAWDAASTSFVTREDRDVHILSPAPQSLHHGDWLTDGDVAKGLVLVASLSDNSVTVQRLDGGAEIFRASVSPELYGGHTPMLKAALSADGSTVAFCDGQGSVRIERPDGRGTQTVAIPGGLIERVALSADGSVVYVIVLDGESRLVVRDVATGRSVAGWDDLTGGRLRLAVGDDRVAVLVDGTVGIRGAASGELIAEFAVEHLVHEAQMAWHGTDLAVRTDAGCVSVYRVPAAG